MNFQIKHLLLFLSLLAGSIFFTGCEEDFEEPPVRELPNIEANRTIGEILALHPIGTPEVRIEEDLITEGVVIADDRSGNFYKTLVIQDETGGLEIRVDATGLYLDYPVGSQIFIKLKGLYVGDFSGKPQISGPNGARIPEPLVGDFLVAGKRVADNPIVPKVVEVNDLAPDYVNTLIQIEGLEFLCASVGVPYADFVTKESVNHPLTTCDGQQIELRTSGFADFAYLTTPLGNGTLTAIYGVFNTDKQLSVRDLDDLQFNGPRCNPDEDCGPAEVITIKSLRDAFEGGTSVAPTGLIQGIVISNRFTGNIVGQNLVIQDQSGGIVVRFDDDHTFDLGEEVQVIVSGLELSEFNGLLQVSDVPLTNGGIVGSGTVEARLATIQEVLANFEDWESTLIKIENATISGGATYSGGLTVEDATGTIEMFTRNGATFAGLPVPSGQVTITAIVSQFNDPQIILRSADDVEGGDTTVVVDPIDISEVRAKFQGSTTTAPAGKIRGIVISDRTAMNETGRNLVVQDGSAGIVVRFDFDSGDHSYNLGDEIEVEVTGLELSEFNGLLQVNEVPAGKATKTGTGMVTPRKATVQEILNNSEAWESTLVEIDMATISGSSTYSGTTTVTDATGSIEMFTRSQATFANSSVPGGAVTMTAIVSQFNDPQVKMRNLDDIQN